MVDEEGLALLVVLHLPAAGELLAGVTEQVHKGHHVTVVLVSGHTCRMNGTTLRITIENIIL